MPKIDLKTKILLAPLSGVSDLSFRLIAREFGARFAFFEMLDANSIDHFSQKTLELVKTNNDDIPIAAQIVGGEPDILCRAAKRILEHIKVSFLDINAACPARKVIAKKAGAHLLNDPQLLFKMIERSSNDLKIPVTVKLRTGYNQRNLKEISRIARGCEKAGAQMLFVHGRLRSQGYSGQVDYAAIKAVKNTVKIPVYGSGDVFTPELAKKMLDETGCDGVMVARGAMGNPWIFRDIEHYLKTGRRLSPPTLAEKIEVAKRHLLMIEENMAAKKHGRFGFQRTVATWYVKSHHEASRLRDRLYRTRELSEVIDILAKLVP